MERKNPLTGNHRVSDLYGKLIGEVSKVIIGKNDVERAMVVALLAGGHVLIEGLPGTAKTTIVKTFAAAIGGDFKRIQFTPDMMPADVTGFFLFSPDGTSRFIPGPIFANVVLADELNRTTPRTQSALLEVMQEGQVTIERQTHILPRPFMVIATQVYAGGEGTYRLTDVQIDRFLLRVTSDYSSRVDENRILTNIDAIDEPDIKAVTAPDEIMELRELTRKVYVSPAIVDYITAIAESLRSNPDVSFGPSSRATIALYKCSRVLAMLDGRDFVIPDDIKQLVLPALEHRVRIKPEAEMDDITPKLVLQKTLEKVAAPKLEV